MRAPHRNRRKQQRAKYWWVCCGGCDGAAVNDTQKRCPRCGHIHSFGTVRFKRPAPEIDEWAPSDG